MASPLAGSRRVVSVATRGSGSFWAMLLTMDRVTGPDSRKTAMAARPAPEATAKIVSLAVGITLLLLFHFGTDSPVPANAPVVTLTGLATHGALSMELFCRSVLN